MSNQIKGWLQLIFVVLFVVGSFQLAKNLVYEREGLSQNSGKDRIIYVEVQEVLASPYRISFETTGLVEAKVDIDVVPEVSGRVVEVSSDFFEGGQFKKGQLLFKVDPRDFELEVQRLEAEVAQAKTALDLEDAESEASLLEWKQINGDKQPPPLVARVPQLAEAKANLKAAEAKLEDAKLDLERCDFSLPFDGRVLSSKVAEGNYVNKGQSYGQVFDIDTLEARVSLEDKQFKWLLSTDNPDIFIKVKQFSEIKRYQGYLRRGAASLNAQTRFATVNIGFKDPIEDLLPGTFAEIEISGATLDDVSLIPISSLQKDGSIWLVKEDSTIYSLQPEILYSNNHFVAVQNLAKKIQVVTSKLSGATEGMKVLVKPMKSPTRYE